MNKLLALLCILLNFGCSPSESKIKSKVVQLVNERGGSCSGEQVRAASGQDYILTASHCIGLAKNGSMTVISEDGKRLQRKIVAEDPEADLLLLEGLPGVRGLDIAKYSYSTQWIRTYTHGAGYKTFRTDGVLVQDDLVTIAATWIEGDCPNMPKFKVMEDPWFGQMCAMVTMQTVTTAFAVPGSSGGAVVDANGDLMGVVSAGGRGFVFLVPTFAIKNFLRNY